MTLRAVIVDDEPLARATLRVLLARDADVSVAAECDGSTAAAVIREAAPDLLFLDIQMPEVDGFQVLAELGVERVPAVIFVTAYDQHALRAFDVGAVDYLLKPFDDARFARALQRAKDQLARPAGAPPPGAPARPVRRFLVREQERLVIVRADEVDWIGAADYYASLHVGKRSFLIRQTMAELELELDPGQFVRIHRSTIVNFHRVDQLLTQPHGDYAVVLRDGTTLKLSRSHRDRFEQALLHR